MAGRHRVRVTRWVQNTRAGAGVGEFLYPQANVGMGVGKILSSGCGCGWTIPSGFIPIAISIYTGSGRRSVIPYVLCLVVFVLSRGEGYKARELIVAKAKGSDV